MTISEYLTKVIRSLYEIKVELENKKMTREANEVRDLMNYLLEHHHGGL